MLKKEDRFCQFDPVTKYLEKTGDQFDNAVVYFIGHGFQYKFQLYKWGCRFVQTKFNSSGGRSSHSHWIDNIKITWKWHFVKYHMYYAWVPNNSPPPPAYLFLNFFFAWAHRFIYYPKHFLNHLHQIFQYQNFCN